MPVKSTQLGLAAAITAAILWVLCSAMVYALPDQMSMVSGHMMHMNLADFGWMLTVNGFFIGLIAWSAVAFLTGWLIGFIYNYLS